MTDFRPMLAVKAELDKIQYPVLASPKFDGIRCVIPPELGPLTRTLISIPNEWIRSWLTEIPWLDGEIIVGSPIASDVFNVTQSAVMSRTGYPDFRLYAFDHLNMESRPFMERLAAVFGRDLPSYVIPVEHKLIANQEEMVAYTDQCVAAGYEGAMVRSLNGPYKHGRSTLKQGWLLKVKPLEDAEAVVVGFEELMVNNNPPTINALGLQERSSHQDNLRPGGVLGALVVEMDWHGATVQFNIGTGFTDLMRHFIWQRQREYLGQSVTFKYQAYGSKDKPRIPVFKGFRDLRDIGG